MMLFYLLIFFTVSASANESPNGREYLLSLSPEELSSIPREITEDALLDVPGLITKYGYPIEIHEVQTDDGYLLTLHRIPHGKNEIKQEKKIPVLIMHGLFSSSADWIINGPEKGLGYILADEGYDVWLANARGNYYSRKHVSLNPDKWRFWRFSWNEIGQKDIPASIDYILELTNNEKLHYIGFSQGTTSFLVMGSTKTEYNNKLLSVQLLAPVAYSTMSNSPLISQIVYYMHSMKILLSFIGVNELLPNTEFMTKLGDVVCGEESKYLPFCANLLFSIAGYNPDQLNLTMIPTYLGHTPAGASTDQVIHYAQLSASKKFHQYDYGIIGNIMKYNSPKPPLYRMKKITAPVALHYGDNDKLADPQDVFLIHKEISNPIGLFRIPDKNFNHLDFMWAIDVKTLVYDQMIDIMRQYE